MSPPGSTAASLAQPEKNSGQAPTRDTTTREPSRQAASCVSEGAEGAGKQGGRPEEQGAGGPGTGSGFGDTHDTTIPTGGPQAGVRSIMKRREEAADPAAHRRSLQFVGVNGG